MLFSDSLTSNPLFPHPTLTKTTSPWLTLAPAELTPTNFELLFENKLPALALDNFFTLEECSKLVTYLKQNFVTEPPYHKVGAVCSDFNDKLEYFKKVSYYQTKLNNMYETLGFSPMQKMLGLLQDRLGITLILAEEPEYGEYSNVVYRFPPKREIPYHYHFASYDNPELSISNVTHQLVADVYLDIPEGQGEVEVSDLQGEIEGFEKYRMEGTNGTSAFYKTVEENAKAVYKSMPKVGDLVIVNAKNLHYVPIEKTNRVNMGFYIGKMREKYIYWI